MVRIVVADDHALVRDTLRRVIEREPDLQIVGEAPTVVSTIERVRALRPDLLLLDLTMPGGGAITALDQIRAASPATRILVLTIHDDPAYLRAALTSGASGFLRKDAAARELPAAVRAVLQGHTYVDPVTAGTALDELWRAAPACAPAGAPAAGAGVRAPAWNELLAAALSHDIVNLVVAASADAAGASADAGWDGQAPFATSLSDHLHRLRDLGGRLNTLASAGRNKRPARIDQAYQAALAEATRLPTQTVVADPIPPDLCVAACPGALKTVIVSLLEHVFAACPDAASVRLSARRATEDVLLEIVAPEAWTVGAADNQRLEVLLATERRDLRADSSLVIAGAIADALGGAIRVTSGAGLGLRLALYLKAAGSPD